MLHNTVTSKFLLFAAFCFFGKMCNSVWVTFSLHGGPASLRRVLICHC